MKPWRESGHHRARCLQAEKIPSKLIGFGKLNVFEFIVQGCFHGAMIEDFADFLRQRF
jgi:hypothetical protein